MSGQTPNDLEKDELPVLRAYRSLPRSEPSAELDAAVLAMARAALPAHSARRGRPTWFIGLATAATVVIAAGIGIQLGRQQTESSATQAPRIKSVEKRDRSRDDIVEVITLPSKPSAEGIAPADAPAPAAASPASAAAPAAPPVVGAIALPQLEDARQEPAQGPAAERAKEEMLSSDYGTYGSRPGQRQAPVPIGAMKPQSGGDEADSRSSAQPTVLAEPQPFPVEQEAAAASARRKNAAEGARGEYRRALTEPAESKVQPAPMRVRERAAEPTGAAGGFATSEAPPAVDEAPAKFDNNPSHWIARIRKLLRDRQHGDAMIELKRFREQNPDYALPPDLRELGQ